MMPVKKSAKNDVSDGAFARLQHNSRYSLEFDVGLDETSPTYELLSPMVLRLKKRQKEK